VPPASVETVTSRVALPSSVALPRGVVTDRLPSVIASERLPLLVSPLAAVTVSVAAPSSAAQPAAPLHAA
jgi:hypothetical protein